MSTLWQDLRFGWRMLAKNPTLSLIAMASLALAIGANTAIFTVWNAVLLRSVSVTDPARVVNLYTQDLGTPGLGGATYLGLSIPNFRDYAAVPGVFSGLSAFQDTGASLRYGNQTDQVRVEMTSGNYFQMLGVSAAKGRTYTAPEAAADGQGTFAVLDYDFWRRRFGGDPAIIGKTVALNGRSFMVTGVAAADFHGTQRLAGVDLWVPITMHDALLTGQFKGYFPQRRPRMTNVIGRLAPGVALGQAQAAVRLEAQQLAREYPADNRGQSATLVTLAESAVNPNARPVFEQALGMMLAVVGLVLLIACANVANLLLARGMSRHREIAVRLAMGATRKRLIRQLLCESTLLALLAGAAGLWLARWACTLLWANRPTALLNAGLSIPLDARVLWFALGISLLTGIGFGLAPALHATRMDLITQLKERSQPALSGQRPWNLRGLLLIGEVGFALIALIISGLFLSSLRQTENTNPGFAASQLASLRFDLGTAGYSLRAPGANAGSATPSSLSSDALDTLLRQLQARAAAIPGVASVTIATGTPMAAAGFARSYLIEGEAAQTGRASRFVSVESISPGNYFSTMGIPLLEGRDFLSTDGAASQKVIIVNQTMAKQVWPGQDAVGKQLKFTGDTAFTQVIGVARDIKYFTLSEDPTPFAYFPLAQYPATALGLTVRTLGPPTAALGAMRQTVQSLVPGVAVAQDQPASIPIAQSLWVAKAGAYLLTGLALLATLLSAIGIFGVMSYGVRQRSRELGIRVALGASSGKIFTHVLAGGMALVAIGAAVGIVGALLLGHAVAALLFGVGAADPATFAAYSLLFLLVALAAGFFPARRATRVDPIVTLRSEQ